MSASGVSTTVKVVHVPWQRNGDLVVAQLQRALPLVTPNGLKDSGFHATLVENGVNRWKQRAIAGKLSTPTPQLNATAVGVILNPWWEVPKSIEHEAAGKKGFVPVKGPDGSIQRWRQPPGPTNALGQIKFVMPNSKAIYLHDTNARSRFNSDTRALSSRGARAGS